MADRKIAPIDFECEAAYAPLAYNADGGLRPFPGTTILQLLERMAIPHKLGLTENTVLPVALRWRVTPNLGLPVEPFRLWRKIKKSRLPSSQVQVFNLSGNKVVFLNGPFFRLHLKIQNNDAVNRTFTLRPLDVKYGLSGSKTFSVGVAAGSSSFVIIDQPNTSGLLISGGNASVASVTGITMLAYLNDPDWELVQVVGLPFVKGSIDANLYNTGDQGFANALVDPKTACMQRVDLYRTFYVGPQPTASDGATIPSWKVPNGSELYDAYVKTAPIKNGKTGTLADIEEMLRNVYQVAPSLYNGMQRNYLKKVESLGIVDPANPNPANNGRYQNPVCSSTLMSSASDCWHALGLGFGTTDFLPYLTNGVAPSGGLGDHDYMVTTVFQEPVLTVLPKFPFGTQTKFTGFEKQEYAALCHFNVQKPAAPSSLLAETTGQNRPLVRDDNYYEAVRLSWAKPAISVESPLCYAVAFRNNMPGGNIRYLHAERPFIPGNPQPYVPALRADSEAEDQSGRDGNSFDRFFHDRSPVPFIGSATQQYYVAAQNVFGLWSTWAIAPHTLNAKLPQIPGVVSAKFTTRHDGIANHIYPADLEVVLSFDWDDRTPLEIHFGGYFLSPPVPEPAPSVPGITHSNNGGTMTRYRIRFSGGVPRLWKVNPANVVVLVTPDEGIVVLDNSVSGGSSSGSPNPGGSDSRAYRVVLKNMVLNFSAQTRLYYVVYARAIETRNPALFSAYNIDVIPGTNPAQKGKPIIIQANDPLPRTAPAFTPAINWASLPDATNTSRYHLKFAPVPGAAGYAVYVATEMSLRDRLAGIANYPTNGSVFQRRDALNGASAADKARAVDAFTRLTKKMLTAPETELALNGDTGGLYIYAVSSFTDQNVESALSEWIYVAVPERITPGAPTLTGFVNKTTPTPLNVLKLTLGPGKNTDRVELFRTDKKYLSNDLNLMGLPYNTGPGTGWQKIRRVNGVEQTMPAVETVFDYYKIEQAVEPGWAPLYYRAVALGLNQPNNGKMPGRSPSSNVLELLPPTPPNPPDLQDVVLVANAELTQLRLSFKSNAFVGKSPHGDHTLVVYKQKSDGLWEKMAGGALPLVKKVAPSAETSGELLRLQGMVNGRFGYVYNFPWAKAIALKICVSDPLGRKTEVIAAYKKPPEVIIIKELTVQKTLTAVNVSFKTTASKKQPAVGAYSLNIRLVTLLPRATKSMITVEMHKIKDTLPPQATTAIAGGVARDLKGFYTYGAVFKGTANLTAFNKAQVIVVSITNPDGEKTELELKL